MDPLPQTLDLHTAILRHEDPARLIHSAADRSSPAVRVSSPVTDLPLLDRTEELQALERGARAALAGQAGILLVEGEAGIGRAGCSTSSPLVSPVAGSDEQVLRARPRSAVRAACRRPAGCGGEPSRGREPDQRFCPWGDPAGARPLRAARRSGQGSCAGVAGRPGRPARAARARHRRPTVGRPVHHRRARRPLPAPRRDAAGGGRRLRSEEVPSDHPVRALDATLHLDVEPLTPDDVAPLGITGLHERTGGNPLFVVERLRAATEGAEDQIPDTLRDLIVARCRRAGADAHRLLVVARWWGARSRPACSWR